MVGYLGTRLFWALVTLWIYLTVLFFFMQVWVPFTWATQFTQGGLDEAAAEAVGLDRPLPVRYLEFMGNLIGGDLGTSFAGGDVRSSIWSALPVTLFIFAVGGLIAYVAGDALGRTAAWRRGRWAKAASSSLGVLSATTFPPLLVFILAFYLWLPMHRARLALGLPRDSLHVWQDRLLTQTHILWILSFSLVAATGIAIAVRAYARRHGLRVLGWVALPVLLGAVAFAVQLAGIGTEATDALFQINPGARVGRGSSILALAAFVLIAFGQVMFVTRISIEDERHADYVLTARAKGVPSRLIRDRHVVRNAMAPALTASLVSVPTILAGMIIVEWELEMGGLSTLFFDAMAFQDTPMIMGVLVVLGVLGIVVRLVTELVVAGLDPRVRAGST